MDEFDVIKEKQNIFRKIYNHIGVISIGLAVSLVLLSLLLNLVNLRFRLWIYYTVLAVSALGMLIGAIRWFKKQIPKVKKLIAFVVSALVVLGIIFWQIPIYILLIASLACQTEHVVEVNGQKYVAHVQSGLLNTSVYYYDYIGPIFVGTEAKFDENYKGSFDPIKRKQEKEEEERKTLQKQPEPDYVEDTNFESGNFTMDILPEVIDEKDILYKKEINSNTSIRIVYSGSILGGKIGIRVQKTADGGNTWKDILNSPDRFMTVNSEAEFVFFNEKVGVINNKSLIMLGEENDGLLVTVDGGEDFKPANFVFPIDVKDTAFYVEDLPYLENGKLHIKLFAPAQIGASYGNYYNFVSIDNGLSWKVEEKV